MNVRFGSLTDIAAALPYVRFTLESGHHRKPSSCPLSATAGPPMPGQKSSDNISPILTICAKCQRFCSEHVGNENSEHGPLGHAFGT